MTFQSALQHVTASLLVYDFQLESEVFQRTELWKNDLSLT